MGLFDRARSLLRTPADRRLEDAAIEAWGSAPAPSAALAVRTELDPPREPARPPSPDWRRDQPPPPPARYDFRPGHSDHTYQQFGAPLAFEFDLDSIRAAVAQHRLGVFWQTSALLVAVCGFAPVLAALQQAIAPILALPRHVHGGDKGLARLIASEVEEALVPRGGLRPSRYLAPTAWGTMAVYLRMLGFCVLQHIDGDPDPETGVRPRFTRIWPPWAVQRYRSPRKDLAITTEGPIEICNDGKFTMVEDEQEGHLTAAICALGEEAFAGKITQQARLSFLNFFGEPKLWAMPPEHIATGIDDDDGTGGSFWRCIQTIRGPGGFGVLPHGSQLQAVGISGEGSKAFSDALVDAIIHVFMVLVGSAGTIGNGANQGGGEVYQPAKGGAWKVRHDLIARPTLAIVRALNAGHVAPYVDQNYGDEVARARKAGAWKDPVLAIPIPAPDRDERIASDVTRIKALAEIVQVERAAGAEVTQDRVEKLAERLEVPAFTLLAGPPITIEAVEKKTAAVDEWRAQQGLGPLPDGAGSVERLAKERLEGGDETGALAKVKAADVKADAVPVEAPPDAPAEDAAPVESIEDAPVTLPSAP